MTVNQLTTDESAETPVVTGERADLLETLAKHREFLRFTTRGLTDEQAGLRTTKSELCLGGLIKHVTAVERSWVDFILEGPSAMPDFTAMTEEDFARWAEGFRMLPGETLAGCPGRVRGGGPPHGKGRRGPARPERLAAAA